MSKAHDKISAKKKELELNLTRIQEDLDRSIDEVKDNVTQTLSPKEVVRKYPIPIVGASLLLGFLLGSKSSSSNKGKVSNQKVSSNDSLISSIGNNLKKRITQKVIDSALNLVEEKISEKKNQ